MILPFNKCWNTKLSKRRILIIDDDPDIINLFKLFLEHDGYKVNAYTDPVDALYAFRKNTFDLILLDFENAQDVWYAIISEIKKYRSASLILLYNSR